MNRNRGTYPESILILREIFSEEDELKLNQEEKIK